jgi:hypothetical protein
MKKTRYFFTAVCFFILDVAVCHLVSGSWYSSPGIRELVLVTWYSSPGTRHLVLVTWYPGAGTRQLGSWYSSTGIRELVLVSSGAGTRQLVSGSWYSSARELVLVNWYICSVAKFMPKLDKTQKNFGIPFDIAQLDISKKHAI